MRNGLWLVVPIVMENFACRQVEKAQCTAHIVRSSWQFKLDSMSNKNPQKLVSIRVHICPWRSPLFESWPTHMMVINLGQCLAKIIRSWSGSGVPHPTLFRKGGWAWCELCHWAVRDDVLIGDSSQRSNSTAIVESTMESVCPMYRGQYQPLAGDCLCNYQCLFDHQK